MANGWHWGVARRLLAMLMALTVAQPAEASLPAAPRTTTVSWMAAQFGGGPLDMSPPPRLASRLDLPEDDPDEHWRQALRLTRCTVTRRPQLEPAVERVMELIATWRHDVVRIRGEVLAEIKEMVAEWAAETEAWMAQRPAPVRSTYATADKDRPTQIPVLLELLGVVGYPDIAGITADLTDGFDMLGEAPAGRTGRTAVIRTRRRWISWLRPTGSMSGGGRRGLGPASTGRPCCRSWWRKSSSAG